MKEKLRFEWQEKYDRVLREYHTNQRRITSLEKRQNMLVTDIVWQGIFAAVCIIVILFIGMFQEEVAFYFVPLYRMALIGIKLAAIFWNMRRLIHLVIRYLYHKKKTGSIQYPKPEIALGRYSNHTSENYYEERVCIEWVLKRYSEELMQLNQLKRRIETCGEEQYDELLSEINQIVIYETVGTAKRYTR